MGELHVLAPADAAVGYRLAGVRTTVPDSAAHCERLIGSAVTAGDADVRAVHDRVWGQLAPRPRQTGQQCSVPLVVVLPEDAGDAVADRAAALRDLLARAVGYEITFSQEVAT
jgi:vacuolar-type H+-ATPase subunit F/Vma7